MFVLFSGTAAISHFGQPELDAYEMERNMAPVIVSGMDSYGEDTEEDQCLEWLGFRSQAFVELHDDQIQKLAHLLLDSGQVSAAEAEEILSTSR